MDQELIKKILVDGNYVSADDLSSLEKKYAGTHVSFHHSLIDSGLITKDILGQALAEYHQIPYTDLNSHTPDKALVTSIPEDIARKARIVLIERTDHEVTLATDNPALVASDATIPSLFPGLTIKRTYALSEDIEAIFGLYRQELGARFNTIIQTSTRIAPDIINQIILDAVALRASDIHIEPLVSDVVVRFRIDGVLAEVGRLGYEYYENILNRVKVQAGLRIDEHASAQDGSIHYVADAGTIDLRLSIVPTIRGEKINLRLLGSYVRELTLAELGLSDHDQQIVSRAADRPFGMILVAGPTGSGKTTTLYALLERLNRTDVNITTIEDPVEYRLEGVNQIQVNTVSDLTFATGLRSIVRQDPDIILVGEIRDHETAEISVNAALTGHLLLSTFHANDAATAIPRLLDMGIEPFLLSSTLEVIVGQRLARRLCDTCRTSQEVTHADLSKYMKKPEVFFPKKSVIYKGTGCKSCGGTGYRGRVGIFEIIEITKELRELIMSKPDAKDIWTLATKQGAVDMFADGIEKVKAGLTSLDEVLRVVGAPR